VEESARGSLLLVLGFHGGRVAGIVSDTRGTSDFGPNQWISIDQTGVVTVRAHKSEMGQGVRTAIPAIIAAELGADWSRVRVVHAEPGPNFLDMGTSGSSSVEDSWVELRHAAAAARTLLTDTAAARWGVPTTECRAGGSAITHVPSGRMVSFSALVADAAQRPIPADVRLRPERELSVLGTRLRRVDTPDIVRGRAIYGIDIRVPSMQFAVLARPPVAGAKVARFDEPAARAIPGVTNVVRTPSGVAVVAANSWAAIRGRTALAVEWDNASRPDATTTEFVQRLTLALPDGKMARREGDVAAALARATRKLEATYETAFQAHAALEPLTCVADVRTDRCSIWVGTQRPNGVKTLAAQMLGLREDQIDVHVALIGGAFGRRIATDHAREAIELSHAIGTPVQVLWTREDDFAHDMFQPAQVNRIEVALGDRGEILAWRQQVSDYHLSMFGPRDPTAAPAAGGDPWGGFDTPYVFEALEVTFSELDPPVPTGAWRSVAYPGGVFARESFLDEIAHMTHRDPLDLRLELLSKRPNDPARRNAARTAARLRNVLTLAAERARWKAPVARPADGRRRGRGLACNPYGAGAMVAQVADVSVGPRGDIRVHHVTTAIDVGRVIDRSGLEAQVEGGVAWALSAALNTEITFDNGRAQQTNFDRFPVLRMREMPAQEIIVVDGALGPFGAGEPPVPAVYAAVANAVFAATGERVRKTPIKLGGIGVGP
jgi:isoquinoline 1-oxidoreductase beta subunit